MALFRRKRADPEILAAFRRVTVELDAAQRALLSAIPTSRDPGTPLAAALDDFIDRLTRAQDAMPAWRTDQTETIWLRCREALKASHDEAERLRNDPATERIEFEPLNARLGDIVSPLEEFADAAGEIRRLTVK